MDDLFRTCTTLAGALFVVVAVWLTGASMLQRDRGRMSLGGIIGVLGLVFVLGGVQAAAHYVNS
ncbi:hypothetical protein ACFV2Q_37675 [Streptomyces sp. NPDC059650]|uniref:hypothetical protein n=1 Tax=Streptomyces sp. NPDC059650 TaxID=3346896 RepID=UPI0036B1BD5F